MYDPNWPHGHTYNGMKCRVLADDLLRPDDACFIAIAVMCANGITETVARVVPDELMPIPAPKKRIQGWLAVYAGGDTGHKLWGKLQDAKDMSSWNPASAYVYIDVEEGEGLEPQT